MSSILLFIHLDLESSGNVKPAWRQAKSLELCVSIC
jgi:hypothetical protein